MAAMATATATDYAAVWEDAHAAGSAAADALTPDAMIVQGNGRTYYVADGVCGFAWVNFAANTGFGRWAKASGRSRKDSYWGGQTYWIGAYGQSMQRKEAYARAFAAVLDAHGIKAWAGSRMD